MKKVALYSTILDYLKSEIRDMKPDNRKRYHYVIEIITIN